MTTGVTLSVIAQLPDSPLEYVAFGAEKLEAVAQVRDPGKDGGVQLATGAGLTVTVAVWVMVPHPQPLTVQDKVMDPPLHALKLDEVMVPFADPEIRQLPDCPFVYVKVGAV